MATNERTKALEHVWWIEYSSETSVGYHEPSIALAKVTSADTTTSFTTATASKSVRIYGSVYDEDFVESGTGIALTEEPNIPSQFHEALAFKVIAELYRLPGEKTNLQLAAYYDQMYEIQVREAKKYARRNHQRGGVVKPYNY